VDVVVMAVLVVVVVVVSIGHRSFLNKNNDFV
jgi:hypothetical protein